MVSRAPIAKDCADCASADCGLEPASCPFRDLGPPRGLLSLSDSGSARILAQNAPLESSGDQFRCLSWTRAVP
eukprot:15468371-Alexandrium_andersonii.AAC.1